MNTTSSISTKANNTYLVEFYTKNPATGESGWDIHFAWVGAKNSTEARLKVRSIRNFGEVIDCGEHYNVSPLAGVTQSSLHFLGNPRV